MSHVDNIHAYFELADNLLNGQITEADLSRSTTRLPTPYEQLITDIAHHAEETVLMNPKFGWALTQVVSTAADSYECKPLLRSLATWYLARASNHWGQPKRVASAIIAARHGFEILNEQGWCAACDWQQNALSWARPNFIQAAAQLEESLEQLELKGFDYFVPHCRLALAYAQILIGKFDSAQQHTLASERFFISQNDHLNQARCWLNIASSLRRQGKFDPALEVLEKADRVFQTMSSAVDDAKVHYQVALCHLMSSDDLQIAVKEFKLAADIFNLRSMDLWQGACISNLGYTQLLLGELAAADQSFSSARSCFARHGVLGLLTDNLNDSGKLNILRGLPRISTKQFKQAMKIHEKLGEDHLVAVDMANLGESYGQMGRYQDALYHLESASEKLESLNDLFRLGACEKFTARVWILLGNPKIALEHLDKAEACHKKLGQKALMSSIYNSRANIYFGQSEDNKAIEYLKMSMKVAQEHGVRPQAALAKRLLGEALIRIDHDDEALVYLKQAYTDFSEMGMVVEHAASLIDLGLHYIHSFRFVEAKEAFQTALHLSEGTFFEVDWRAYSGLAQLSEKEGDLENELFAYRQGIKALERICSTFWQPSLIGSYLQDPSSFFDKAISRAAESHAVHDVLIFIEANKSTTLLQQLLLQSSANKNDHPQQMIDIKAEISLLQDQMRTSFDQSNPLKTAFQTRQIRDQLIEKMKDYDTYTARFERRNNQKEGMIFPQQDFSLDLFRQFAEDSVGKSWIALDYHMNKNKLITIVLTPDDCQVHSTPVTERVAMALSINARNIQPNSILLQEDLRVLGNFLLPKAVTDALTPDTYLFIAPHKMLHGIPWSAIHSDKARDSLVINCIPSVVPSLRSLLSLWIRSSRNAKTDPKKGLLFGVSEFQDIHKSLPNVKTELDGLFNLAPSCQFLSEESATWENLMKLCDSGTEMASQNGLSRFTWLHIASHITTDTHTGRLIQVALRKGNLLLDQLRDLSPLPPLVTFSACNGLYSFIYEGDEHVSLQTTCLIAGANSVVGSIWPIIDRPAAFFAVTFYGYYMSGIKPALCLALTQRQLIKFGNATHDWAGFMCVGMP